MPTIEDNRNYHAANQQSVFDRRLEDQGFAEYRRQWRDNPRNGIVAAMPLNLDVEATNACNLRCPHCASTSHHWGNPRTGFMDSGLFRSILTQAKGVYCIKFSLRGEPLLHPQIAAMVAAVLKAGIPDCYFNTNGMLLDRKMAEALLDASLPRISISVDGWDKDSFERCRPGADYHTVCNNISQLRNLRDNAGLDRPQIRVQTVMFPDLAEHWPEYVRQWSDIADEVGYVDGRCEGSGGDHRGKISAGFSCPFLWQRMTVLWDGELLPCLMHGVDDFSLMSLGNVRDLDLATTWHSPRLSELRKIHRQGRSHLLPACDQCSYRGTEIAKQNHPLPPIPHL